MIIPSSDTSIGLILLGNNGKNGEDHGFCL